MENFVVSALKYRPASFDTVVGQESITKTLENAIANDELAKAYLFCGPRGVGKTTCARIFAKAINEGVSGIDADYSYNLFELDAASNNSVDDIRHIIDQVRVPPQIGKYKVYIIDEVHMLSKAAFNAFLKTLEEPPPHAIFVLATTEKHKVLPTILSRCQIYDFKRISVGDMVIHLEKVATSEKISFEKEALHLIAQKADGALRDALSIFDQMVSFTGKNLSREAVADSLNVLDYDYFFRAAENFSHGDVTSSLLLFDEVIDNGFDPLHYLNGLNEHFRNLLVVKDKSTLKLLDQTDKIRDQYVHQSEEFSMAQLLEFLEEGQKTSLNYRTSNYKRLLVEILLMKYCSYGKPLSDEKKKSSKRIYTSVTEQGTPPTPNVAPPSYAKIIISDDVDKKIAEVESTNDISIPTKELATEVMLPSLKSTTEAPLSTPKLETHTAVETTPQSTVQEVNEISKPETGTNKTPSSASTPMEEQSPSSQPEPADGVINISKKKSLSRHSISMMDMEEDAGNLPEEDEEIRSEAFTHEQMVVEWKKYADVVRERGKIGFATSLGSNIPVIRENHVLEITLENQVQVENINDERGQLNDFLRNALKNDHITITTVVNDDEAPIEQLGPEDQLRNMMKKNKNLQTLFEDLDLDIER